MSVTLPRVVTAEDFRPVTCRVPPDVLAELEAYATAYQATHGVGIPLPMLLLALAQEALRKDRAFLQWKRAQPTRLPTAGASAEREDRHQP